jgi:hypothetical protein
MTGPIFVQSPHGYINLSLVTQISVELGAVVFAGDPKNNLRFCPEGRGIEDYIDWLKDNYPDYFPQPKLKQAAE